MAEVHGNGAVDFFSDIGAIGKFGTSDARITFDTSDLVMDTGPAAWISAIGGTSPTHYELKSDYDQRMALLGAMDYGVGDDRFTKAVYTPNYSPSTFDVNALTTVDNSVSAA